MRGYAASAVAGFMVAMGVVHAEPLTTAQQMNADDMKWVNQCIADNKDEPGGTPAVVRAYCLCMNEKMGNSETRSISQWEESHQDEREACEEQAGWK